MGKKIPGHIVGFGELQYWEEYEDWIWPGGAMSYERYDAYMDTTSKNECDRLCEELPVGVVTYKINKQHQ